MIGYKWESIAPLEANLVYDFDELDSLQQQWLSVKAAREQESPEAYTAFLGRLTRSWAIETGIIEGLYTLDRGATETLVLRGISADLIEQGSTNKEPHELVLMLRDHQDAAEGVREEIREERPISRSAIRQIHSTMTRHQPTFRAVNQFGIWFDALLNHGQFKRLPNNPTRPDGTVHQYCPPEHVDSELENLLRLYHQYDEGIHHILRGAWLHHRFTQIHPFQDGNGRVARTLLTWHLIKEGYLPIVIKRDDRERYIEALENADQGDLFSFVELLVQLQKQSILEAVGEPEVSGHSGPVDQVLDHIVEQIGRQHAARESQLRSVGGVAAALRDKVAPTLQNKASQISDRLEAAGRAVEFSIDSGGPGDREHWYAREIIETANNSRHWVNRTEARYFARVVFTPRDVSKYPRMVFVISLHSTGRQLTGIMTATSFARIAYHQEFRSDEIENVAEQIFEDCTVRPFTFTWENDANSIFPRFKEWAEQCLAPAVRKWGEYLT